MTFRDHRPWVTVLSGIGKAVLLTVAVIPLSRLSIAQVSVGDGMPQRTDTLIVAGPGPFLIHPFLLPESVQVVLDGNRMAASSYRIEGKEGFLYLPDRSDMAEVQLIVTYRYVPISVTGMLRRWPVRAETERERDAAVTAQRPVRIESTERQVPGGQMLSRSGSITRGITTGSGRDVAIESGLRLQVEGQLVEGLNLRAVLTDENTPIVPEGTTQRLNDFDRVFIELESVFGSVQLGDIEGRINGGSFARLNRKLQGVAASVSSLPVTGDSFGGGTLQAAAATSRGTLRIQEITPVDGIQGPYRLEGTNGERFIILLPGSEIVYLDGTRLERGATNDYVVDYATGEITFTPRRIISADRRISVEFQYTTQQFTRTLIAGNGEAYFGTRPSGPPLLQIGISAIREVDGDQFSEEFGLTSADSVAISQAGDESAFRSGASPVVYDAEAFFTQYVVERIVDNEGNDIEIYRVVSDEPPDSVQVYRVAFSRVSAGIGSYRRTGLATNGIAYEYVGSGLGEYAPVRSLPKPSYQRLVDFRATLRPHSALRLSAEWAASRLDLNRLSNLDAADDEGSAYQVELGLEPIPIWTVRDTELRMTGVFRRYFRDVNFATFERVRPVEYARRWNIQNTQIDASRGIAAFGNEVMSEGEIALSWSDSSGVSGNVGQLELGDGFKANRIDGVFNLSQASTPDLAYRIEYIASADRHSGEDGEWIRQLARISDTFVDGSLRPYLEVEHEDLRQTDIESGLRLAPSVRFLETRAGIEWRKALYTLGIGAEKRREKRIQSGARVPFDAWTFSSNITASPHRTIHSELQLGYRTTKGQATPGVQASSGSSNESFIVHLSGRWSPGRQGSNVSWMYQVQTERSSTLQEIYIRAGQERGEYVWVDENSDGVIQLEEFLPETTPDEGVYVRTFFPSDSLESVTSARGRLRVELSTGRGESREGFQRLLRGINAVTLIDVEEKSRDPNRKNLYLLRTSRFQTPENTLNGRIRLRQDLGLLRHVQRADLNLTAQTIRSLTELAAGEESRDSDLLRVAFRFMLGERWNVGLSVDRSIDVLESASFSSRNYSILQTVFVPTVSWSPQNALQFTLSPAFSGKSERNRNGTATIVRVPINARYGIGRKVDLGARFEVSSVSLSEAFSGRTAFEMTDGRGAGTSYLWRFSLQSNLSEVLTATVSYDGRAPENRPVIHTGRFQLSARF